jgi:hypothetical protein
MLKRLRERHTSVLKHLRERYTSVLKHIGMPVYGFGLTQEAINGHFKLLNHIYKVSLYLLLVCLLLLGRFTIISPSGCLRRF